MENEDRKGLFRELDASVGRMDYPMLLEDVENILRYNETADSEAYLGLCLKRASELGMRKNLEKVIRLRRERQRMERADPDPDGPQLERDRFGKAMCTVDTFSALLAADGFMRGVYFDEQREAPVVREYPAPGREKLRLWTDADESTLVRRYEREHGVYHRAKLSDALRIWFALHRRHPIRERVESLVWDGESRIGAFLVRWAQADDTPYVREVSRLIFAGGIHRLFDPGCKFDYAPVLMGPQGSGKSTLVRWLAMEDEWFGELTDLEGRESVEQMTGTWICEISELLAVTRVKDQEAVKSFLSRQRERYRRPYDKNPVELPRRCIFIGTTNNRQFLRDRTGNRRFCPVEVHSTGQALYAQQTACRAYIEQCWAEAKALYDAHALPCVPDAALFPDFQAAQDAAMEEDWRVGAIENYVWSVPDDHLLCVREVARQALILGDDKPRDPTAAESREIAQILDRTESLERVGRKRVAAYGKQICWRKRGTEGTQNRNLF